MWTKNKKEQYVDSRWKEDRMYKTGGKKNVNRVEKKRKRFRKREEKRYCANK